MTMYDKIEPPTTGSRIRYQDGQPVVPDEPIIPFIRGDGIGADIWPATQRVLDAAVAAAYGDRRRIRWFQVFAGSEACDRYGAQQHLPADTRNAIRDCGIAIKGPLATPVGGGIRSLNVALRQQNDLYACVRPSRHYPGVPSPHKYPERLDAIVYRENTEDLYLGVEWAQGSEVGSELIRQLNESLIPATAEQQGLQIPPDAGIGIKPISKTGSQRLVRRAIRHAQQLPPGKRTVTLVHKGNIMKYTEGAFRDWGYELATTEFRHACVTERESWILGNQEADPELSVAGNARQLEPGFDVLPAQQRDACAREVRAVLDAIGETHGGGQWRDKVLVNDRIADSAFQQIQTRPEAYSILATTNLNGDYLSDAATALVGGLGMGPGANIGDRCAIFEATHGTAPRHAGRDRANPSSLILSGAMMLEFLGWQEAANAIHRGVGSAIAAREVTYDLARLMEPPVEPPLSCSAFAEAIAGHFEAGNG